MEERGRRGSRDELQGRVVVCGDEGGVEAADLQGRGAGDLQMERAVWRS